ncbi:MAG TPA: bifunctional DNA-formamidopyrimidine glycosylase/DNA-(apurinic or apyrimidinic site) lyase [Microbacteriaceae bacterium]|nr:bifunctional DNA-formamidopyrimidine glycosylase/DNA-(apurinic or apyrimidinic site) lyase [Microbacteriaceae bacterium]
MPELPEVETVRRQLAPLVAGAQVESVEVEDARALKRHTGDIEMRVADFVGKLTGATLMPPARRGKFMWIPLASQNSTDSPKLALLAHLGMSGQVLARTEDAPDDRHVRARIWLRGTDLSLLRIDFADQRRFGSLAIDDLIQTTDAAAGGAGSNHSLVPAQAAHIARDPLDPAFDIKAWVDRVKQRRIGIKKLLLDQTLMSGVGNIYADEALWQVKIHPDTPAFRISKKKLAELVEVMGDVFERALEWGGTSFDAQYVNVNGEAGYFAQSLEAYGRTGLACTRCGSAIEKTPFMGRNSHFCPRCQRKR